MLCWRHDDRNHTRRSGGDFTPGARDQRFHPDFPFPRRPRATRHLDEALAAGWCDFADYIQDRNLRMNQLPLVSAGDSRPAAAILPVRHRASARGKRIRVYIVDDHATVRRGVAALIADESDMVVCGEAEDCAKATGAAAKLRPDVVIADISLRGNSGLELIKNLQALDPTIHIVVLSVHDESVYALRVLKAGAKGYVMKQDLASKVIDAVRKVSTGQIYVSDDVAGQMLNRLVSGREAQGDSPVASLSDRELEVVTLIGAGLATREVAQRLNLSVKTVETHRAHIKTKVELSSASQLVQFCVRWVEDSKRLPA